MHGLHGATGQQGNRATGNSADAFHFDFPVQSCVLRVACYCNIATLPVVRVFGFQNCAGHRPWAMGCEKGKMKCSQNRVISTPTYSSKSTRAMTTPAKVSTTTCMFAYLVLHLRCVCDQHTRSGICWPILMPEWLKIVVLSIALAVPQWTNPR